MEAVETVRETSFDRRLFTFLLVLNIIADLIQIPYNIILTGSHEPDYSGLLYIIPLQILWATIFYTIIISIGINLSEKFGYAEPIIKSLLYKEKYPRNTKEVILKGSLAGIAVGICLLLLTFIIGYIIPSSIPEGIRVNHPGAIFGVMASVSAGIREETIFRFCLLLLIIWIVRLFVKSEYVKSADPLFWTANLLSGIIFGAAHLSNLAALNLEMSMAAISIVVFLNCFAGMSFGYVFFNYGLLSAMIAHFSTDIVIHVLFPIAT